MSAGEKVTEVRLGRNFLRVGDTCKVKLPGKTRFSSGWKVKEFDGDTARVVNKDGRWRYVPLTAIQRVAQTKNGVRKADA